MNLKSAKTAKKPKLFYFLYFSKKNLIFFENDLPGIVLIFCGFSGFPPYLADFYRIFADLAD